MEKTIARKIRTRGSLAALCALVLSIQASAFASMPMPVPSIAMGQAQAAPMGGTFLNVAIPANILNLKLRDAHGQTFTLASLKGKTVLIANFLTSCQEICPMTSANMQKIADKVDAAGASKKVVVMELTVDPLRDIPSRLKAYQGLFGSTNWMLATGSANNVAAIWKYFGAPATKSPYTTAEMKTLPKDWQTGKVNTYDVTHADLVLALSKDSRWVWLDLGSPKTVDGKLPATLKKYLTADGLHNLAKPEEPSWSVPAATAALSAISQINIS